MYTRMAGQATSTGQGLFVRGGVVMASSMAAQAQHRLVLLQHGSTVSTMRIVAVTTVFGYSFVSMGKRTTLAGVAGKASVILVGGL